MVALTATAGTRMIRATKLSTRPYSSNAHASVALAACCLLVALAACGGARQAATGEGAAPIRAVTPDARASEAAVEPYAGKMVYVIVALCDNVNQGIVPVAPALGNGDDPARNLHWGARLGGKTFFTASRDWPLVADLENPAPKILETLVFKHRQEDRYL